MHRPSNSDGNCRNCTTTAFFRVSVFEAKRRGEIRQCFIEQLPLLPQLYGTLHQWKHSLCRAHHQNNCQHYQDLFHVHSFPTPYRPCTPRRHPSPRRTRCRRLRPGVPAAHETADVPLLPSGPGGVGQISLRRTRPSLLRAPARPCSTAPPRGIQPPWSGLRVQGTASSPPSTATLNSTTGLGIRD